MAGERLDYIEALTEEGERTAELLTSAETYGGAVAYRSQPCLVIYGVPVWIMPNGCARIGGPDAEMLSREDAARAMADAVSARPAERSEA